MQAMQSTSYYTTAFAEPVSDAIAARVQHVHVCLQEVEHEQQLTSSGLVKFA